MQNFNDLYISTRPEPSNIESALLGAGFMIAQGIQELRWLSRAFPLCIKQEIHSKATIFIIIRLNKVLLVNIMANPIRDSSTIVCQRLAWVRAETS